jgi:glutaredoxin
MGKATHKILKHKDKYKYVIFYSNGCTYCDSALKLLDKQKILYKKYDIDTIGYLKNKNKSKIQTLLDEFNKNKQLKFNIKHTTRPIIFKKGIFLGGYNNLIDDLN